MYTLTLNLPELVPVRHGHPRPPEGPRPRRGAAASQIRPQSTGDAVGRSEAQLGVCIAHPGLSPGPINRRLRRRGHEVLFTPAQPVMQQITWSTWSAVISLTSSQGRGAVRSAPSGPDDRDRVASTGCGQESPSPGGARSQGKGRKVNTGLRGLVPCTGFPLNCRTPPLLGANDRSRELLTVRSRDRRAGVCAAAAPAAFSDLKPTLSADRSI